VLRNGPAEAEATPFIVNDPFAASSKPNSAPSPSPVTVRWCHSYRRVNEKPVVRIPTCAAAARSR